MNTRLFEGALIGCLMLTSGAALAASHKAPASVPTDQDQQVSMIPYAPWWGLQKDEDTTSKPDQDHSRKSNRQGQ